MRDIIRLDGYNNMDDETFQKSIKISSGQHQLPKRQ